MSKRQSLYVHLCVLWVCVCGGVLWDMPSSLKLGVVARKQRWLGRDLGSGPSSARNSWVTLGKLERAGKKSSLPPASSTPAVELGLL